MRYSYNWWKHNLYRDFTALQRHQTLLKTKGAYWRPHLYANGFDSNFYKPSGRSVKVHIVRKGVTLPFRRRGARKTLTLCGLFVWRYVKSDVNESQVCKTCLRIDATAEVILLRKLKRISCNPKPRKSSPRDALGRFSIKENAAARNTTERKS